MGNIKTDIQIQNLMELQMIIGALFQVALSLSVLCVHNTNSLTLLFSTVYNKIWIDIFAAT